MVVSSLSDLYFIASGVFALNTLTQLFLDSGLYMLPILIAVISILGSRQSIKDTMNSLEMSMCTMCAVIFLAFLPLGKFEVDSINTYARQCQTSEQGTVDFRLFEDDIPAVDLTVLLSGQELSMPFLVELALTMGTGLSFAAVSHLPCSIDLQGVSSDLLNTHIKDQRLNVETKEFLKQCYQPAKLLAFRQNDQNIAWIQDPDTIFQPWPGHQDFLNNSYYGNTPLGFYSQSLIPGFQGAHTNRYVTKWVESKRQADSGVIDCSDGTCFHQVGGFPSCQEWWQGIGAGYPGFSFSNQNMSLKHRLYEHIPGDTKARSFPLLLASYPGENTEWYEDRLIEKTFFNSISLSRIRNAEVRDYGLMGEGAGQVAASWLSRIIGTAGNVASAIPEYAGASLVQLAAPIVKGAIILVLLVSFPLVMIVSKFDIKLAVAMSFLIGSVMMWPYFWELTILIQKSYIETVANNSDIPLVDVVTQPNTMLLANRITDALFIGFPLFVTSILSYAGMGVGATLSSATGSLNSGNANAGQKGGNAMSKAGKAGLKAASKGSGK